jgi:uncharacterized protein YcbK (DUF882 family)
MAEMYTPEEINEIFAAYNDAVQKGIPVSKELAQQMKDATLGVKNYTQQLQSSLKQLGTSFKNLGSTMSKGAAGASVFNDTMSSGADAVAAYASKFGPAGQALGLFTKATMAYVGAVNKQADALYKSYKDISRAGVVGAGGMKEVYTNMQRFGYTIDELGEFSTLMKSNSEVLAKFGGTAFNGAEQFANLADQIQGSDIGKNLMLMGVSVDEINKGAAGFLKQQTMLGRNSAGMQKTLAAETAKYLENLEAVSRLTGQSREQLQQKQQDALNEEQFAAKRYEVEQRALAGDQAAKKELAKMDFINETLSGEMRMDAIRSFAGDVAASGRLMTAMPGVFQKFQDETADGADVLFEYTKNARRNITDMNRAFQLGFGADTFYAFKDNAELVAQFGKAANPEELRAMMEAAKKNRITTDEATKTQVDIEKAQRKASNNMQDFLNLGINPVTKAMSILADVVEGLTSFIPGAGRARERAKEAELNKQGKTSARQDQVALVSGSAEDQMAAATGSAGTAQLTPAEQAAYAAKGGPPAINALDYIKFTSGTGSEEHFKKLQPNVQSAFLQMAQEYNSLTGKKLQVNSAFRSPEEQANVNSGTNPKAAPGMSLHNIGRALDIQSDQVADLASQGLLGKFGFKTLAGDPPHISMANGGILSGPRSGYQPNLTMHGTEAVVPLPDGRSIPVSGNNESSSLMEAQLEKLDELVSVMKSQLSVSNKLLSYSS